MRSRRTAVVLCGFAMAMVASLCGCGQSPYELAPVQGTVTVDGQPLPAGQVMFAPRAKEDSINAGKPAIGWLQSDGSFELSTYKEGDGAVVGEHLVTLFGPNNKVDLPAGIQPFRRMAIRGSAVTVVAGQDNRIDIELSAEDFQPLTITGRQMRR